MMKTKRSLNKIIFKQDGNHEPGCSHVILRSKGHNQITVHLSKPRENCGNGKVVEMVDSK